MAVTMAAPAFHRSQSHTSRQQRRSLSTATKSRDDGAALAWDGLRKDTDLWFSDGDCFVHLYAFGASRRGPSFRLRADQIETLESSHLVDQCLHIDNNVALSTTAHYEIYLPAVQGLHRDEAYAYHVTTRNCFAFVAGVPLVGQRLGQALIDLWDRLQAWDARNVTLKRFYEYCERQGYLNLSANAGHALAVLAFAEHVRDSQMYINAFVHCVGMQQWLELNPEYSTTSEKSQILIGRAGLEMELHIVQVSQSMGTFLEDELSPAHVNLSQPARDHLDRFRSFLINHFVQKHGYYPPPAKHPWKKSLWVSMYHSFQCLYEYLADTSPNHINNSGSTDAMIAKGLHAFDERHGFDSLPSTSPLLPTASVSSSSASIHSVTKFTTKFRLSRPAPAGAVVASKALETAANTENPDVMSCSLVKDYRHFERQKVEEKLSTADARQVRWMLIYSTLQMLISIIRAPAEVTDVRTPTYPLCVLTADCPPWDDTAASYESPESSMEALSEIVHQDDVVMADDDSQISVDTTLHTKQIEHIGSLTPLRIPTRSNRSDSQHSNTDSTISTSTLQTPRSSSSISDACDSPTTVSSFSDCDPSDLPPIPIRLRGPLIDNEWRSSVITIGAKSVHAGCYEPTGLHKSAIFCNDSSAASVESFATSLYPEEAQQAGDIAEISTRGRGRITGPGSMGYNVEMPVDLWAE